MTDQRTPKMPVSSQCERGLGFDAGQLLRVADVVEAGDPGVLDTDGHDAVDLAIQADDKCRVAVDPGVVSGNRAFGLAEAAGSEAEHLVGADDRPQRSVFDAAAVGHQDYVRGEYVKEALQVPGFECALERLESRAGLARGNHSA